MAANRRLGCRCAAAPAGVRARPAHVRRIVQSGTTQGAATTNAKSHRSPSNGLAHPHATVSGHQWASSRQGSFWWGIFGYTLVWSCMGARLACSFTPTHRPHCPMCRWGFDVGFGGFVWVNPAPLRPTSPHGSLPPQPWSGVSSMAIFF